VGEKLFIGRRLVHLEESRLDSTGDSIYFDSHCILESANFMDVFIKFSSVLFYVYPESLRVHRIILKIYCELSCFLYTKILN
jgi:hypothetical protein